MALIILNGPTGCGKGEAYKRIRAVFNAGDGRVKKRLHEMASAIFQVPIELWETRQGKETPNPLLTVTAVAFLELARHVFLPDRELPALSPREALIYVSECFAKPTFGADYFGRERLKLISEPGLYVDDSGGFAAEVEGLDPSEVLIIQVTGRGEYSPSDTRGWLTMPGAYTVAINNGPSTTLEEYLAAVTRTVDEWLVATGQPRRRAQQP